MLLKSFKRRVSWATAIVLQFNNIKRELSCEGLETWDGWTPSPPNSSLHGNRRNEPRPTTLLFLLFFRYRPLRHLSFSKL